MSSVPTPRDPNSAADEQRKQFHNQEPSQFGGREQWGRLGDDAGAGGSAATSAMAAPVRRRMGAVPPAPGLSNVAEPSRHTGRKPPGSASDEREGEQHPQPQLNTSISDSTHGDRSQTHRAPAGRRESGFLRLLRTKPLVITGCSIATAAGLVAAAQWLRTIPDVQDFLTTYPGHASQRSDTPSGIPPWLGWQHFLNMFFLVLIIRTGLQVRSERRPPALWTPNKNSFFSPKGNDPKKISLSQWLHQVLDVLWVANGAAFIVLLFSTGNWMRIVPAGWDIFPNMLSAGLQYASLNWPTEDGWIHYNALQLAAYFLTVFVASPLAIVSGLRMSTWWPAKALRLSKLFPIEVARALHFPVMLYFTVFTVIHVALVFFTDALRNLNHMYASSNDGGWWGLAIFLGSLVATAMAWFVTKPLFTIPVAALMGSISKK